MNRLLVSVVLIAFAFPAHAKCVFTSHVASGKVFDASGQPAVGIVVAVSWADTLGVRGPLLTTSDALGNYEFKFWFNTFSKGSWLRGDICKSTLKEVVVAVMGPDGQSETYRNPTNGESNIVLHSVHLSSGSSEPSNAASGNGG